MREPGLRAAISRFFAGLSLARRIQASVLTLSFIAYVVGLFVIGLPLREMAISNVQNAANRELGALSGALQDHALLRDYAAIERVLEQRVHERGIVRVAFTSGREQLAKTAERGARAYPGWFAQTILIADAESHLDLIIGGLDYGRITVVRSAQPVLDDLWRLLVRFTLLMVIGLGLMSCFVQRVLTVNLRGLYALEKAARAFEHGDLNARSETLLRSPPELNAAQRAFNRMADTLNRLLDDLHRNRDELHREKERLRVTIDSIGDAVVVTDAAGCIEFINPRALLLTGLDAETALGLPVTTAIPMVNEDSGAAITSAIELALRHNKVIALDNHTAIRRADGSLVAIRDSAAPIHAVGGGVLGGVLVFQDETERRKLMQRLAWQAERDHLTGLYNRREMEMRLTAALSQVKEGTRQFMFCYMDLDKFKLVNDTCGHRAGDALLQRLTAILMERLKGTPHQLARLGGDEFGILFTDTRLPAALAVVQGIRDEIARFRFDWETQVFRLGVSFGVTEISPDMNDISEILAQADTACYHAKTLGGNAIQIFEHTHPALRRISDEMQWVVVIARAFEEHRFVLYRQKVQSLNPAIQQQHYEVLLRMRSEDGVIVPPGEFLPAAERYGLAPSFDRWVIRNVFAYVDTHPDDHAHYAINLSGRTLGDPALTEFILDTLDQHSIDPKRISFEITETAAIDNLDECERLILAMQSRGIQFALDDFGKGQSSFSYLQRLPVKYLKIDGEFVRGIDHRHANYAITKAINTLAHELDKLTIAEQVETETELACIKRLGVDFVQGYLLHRPELIVMRG
jgi:diguanylate cyclase (GGDEF)-like protein/PAS domain S-box-containing protein